MKQITLLFDVQVWEENLVFIFSKNFKEMMHEILTGKDTEGENPKKYIFVCEVYYSEHQLIKSM